MPLHDGTDPAEEQDGEGLRQALFPGDVGTLDVSARRIMVQLLSGPSLEAERHPKLWPVLLNQELAIRTRLADLFLELVVDREVRRGFHPAGRGGPAVAPAPAAAHGQPDPAG